MNLPDHLRLAAILRIKRHVRIEYIAAVTKCASWTEPPSAAARLNVVFLLQKLRPPECLPLIFFAVVHFTLKDPNVIAFARKRCRVD